jgi:hypothetical protein
MKLPITLLILALAAACSSARAADEHDALAAAVRRPDQLSVLRERGLTRPPKLNSYGLKLDADGVYRAGERPEGSPPGTPRKTPTTAQFSAVLARWLSSHPADAGPAAAAPPTPDAAVVAAHAQNRDRAAALGAGSRFDASFSPDAPALPAARREALRRGLLRFGAERLADGALLGPGGVPETGIPSAWSGLNHSQIDDALTALDRGGDGAIAGRRGELIRLLAAGDGEERGRALRLLGRLHDETLLPVLLPALRRETGFNNRKLAAEALAAIVAGFKAKEGGWDAFLDKAPPVLNVMFKAAPDWNYGTLLLNALYADLDLLNLMEPADEKRFLAGFGDPRVLLMMMSLGETGRIQRDAGVHSDSAALIYARYRELTAAGAPGLGAFLEDPAVSPSTRAQLLDRLNRYRLIGPELERDETLRRDLPKLLFGRGSQTYAQTVFSIAVLAAGMKKADFAKHSMDFIRGSSEADARSAIAFFLLHPQMLSAAQRRELEDRADGLDERVRESLAGYRAVPPVYSHWPKNKILEAALVMTEQDNHVALFLRKLRSLGYASSTGHGGVARFTRRDARGEVRLSLFLFAANNTAKLERDRGWALDRPAVQAAVVAALGDPKYQVVAYRGHVGDYGTVPSDAGRPFVGKVFIDLACDSESKSSGALSSGVMERCADCAFFGTNQTAEGVVNNIFLPEALAALAARESFADMNRRFQARMPRLFSRFTGSWSPARLWEAASNR